MKPHLETGTQTIRRIAREHIDTFEYDSLANLPVFVEAEEALAVMSETYSGKLSTGLMDALTNDNDGKLSQKLDKLLGKVLGDLTVDDAADLRDCLRSLMVDEVSRMATREVETRWNVGEHDRAVVKAEAKRDRYAMVSL